MFNHSDALVLNAHAPIIVRSTAALWRGRALIRLLAAFFVLGPSAASAHPLIENAIDTIVTPQRVIVDVRVAREELELTEYAGRRFMGGVVPDDLRRRHAEYVQRHLHVTADGQKLSGDLVTAPGADGLAADQATLQASSELVAYRFEYQLASAPRQVTVGQDFLIEFGEWSCPCVLRLLNDDGDAGLSLLQRDKPATFRFQWSAEVLHASGRKIQPTESRWALFVSFLGLGFKHIVNGYDHLLFVTALVLAAKGFWDVLKVVTAFTLAHSMTLALSTLNVLTLSERIVEPMIAVSIVLVALQNIAWPRHSQGWWRLAVAFGFGLFHGLGYAGGLKAAMSELPAATFLTALLAFSLGVEFGHQAVIVPQLGLLTLLRKRLPNSAADRRPSWIVLYGSAAIALGGVYYLVMALANSSGPTPA